MVIYRYITERTRCWFDVLSHTCGVYCPCDKPKLYQTGFLFVCLFKIYRPSREFFNHMEPLSSEDSLALHIYCVRGHPFIMVISEDSHLLPSVEQPSCHYRSGLKEWFSSMWYFYNKGVRNSAIELIHFLQRVKANVLGKSHRLEGTI